MATSFLVFFSILLVSIFLYSIPCIGYKNQKYFYSNEVLQINFFSKFIFPILYVTLIIGLRYDVGTDWFAYNEAYDRISSNSLREAFEERAEWLFTLIVYILKSCGCPSYSIFIVCTGIILICYYKTFDSIPRILPYGLFTLFTLDTFFLFLNIMRQGVSFFILLYFCQYIYKRKTIPFIFGVILASGFHKTALLILPFYLFTYIRRPLFNRFISYILYLFTWFFSSNLFGILLNSASFFLDNEYSRYTKVIELWNMEERSGLGLLMIHICDLIIIFFSPYCSKFFNKNGYNIYFNIYFIGILIQNIAGLNMLLARVPYCL